MWKAFSSMPIVTVFNPAEKTIDEISFPAVTVCNVNKVRKSFVKKVQNRYLNAESLFPDEEWLQAYAELRDVGHICEASRTFTQTFINRSDPNFNNTYKELRLGTELPTNISCYKKAREEISDPQKMLRRGSQNCSEMILYCLWLDQPYSCSDLFTQIQTDYGFCCSFNMIPKELMFKNSTLPSDPELQQRIQEWKDADVNYENLVSQGGNSDDYPKKQLRSGRSSGLSFLIDPELDEYFCSNSDDPETDPICKSTLYNCVRDVRKRINQLGWGKSCTKCYPTCTQIHYQSQVSSLRINKKYTEALLKDQISAPEDVSIVHVYFGEDTVHPKLRKELYTFVNLMSNTGGLLGLCMGFSFLSLLEILYYFTIRNIFKYLRFKSGDNTEDTDVHINEVDFRPAVITDKDKTSNMVDKMAMVESMDSRFNSKIFPELYGLSSFKK
ncbi:unnamed protein product [Orchesella dallaii]|uniref:Sodium channel protein Nach n=1 Tax=Orchesella dallaii TaxID=48710 RepID=A0ABP1RSW0_9HEXA